MKKKILFVDDQISFPRTLKRRIDDIYEDIEVAIFGDRKNGIGEIKNNNVGESFIEYLKANKNEYIADVIFCDFQLENGFTALDILDEANRHPSLPPIVVMTAQKNTFFDSEAIESVEKGARGYIIKTDDTVNINEALKYFIREIYITTLRVYEEYKQRIANKIITEINEIEILDKDNKEQNNKVEKLAEHFVKTFTKYYPYYTLFVRKYEKDKLKLLATNIKDEKSKEYLKELDVNNNKMLQDVIVNGIVGNIDMQESLDSEGNIDEQVKKTIIKENLHKGIIKRVGEQGVPLGTISIYSHSKNKMFDKETIEIFSNIIDSAKRDWELIGHNERTTKKLEFIEDILYYEKEDNVWQDLCKLIHQQFNQDSATTKTTIKVYDSLTRELKRVAFEGADCDTSFKTISINDSNISAWVFRNNHFVVLDIDDFKDPNSDKKELKEEFIDKLAKNNRDRNIKYIASNPYMKSELCMPIELNGEVLGVLNLESSHDKIYTKSDSKLRKEIELLLKAAVKRVEDIRLKRFEKLLYTLGIDNEKEVFYELEKFLKDFIDFIYFSIIIIDDSRLRVEYISQQNLINKTELENIIGNQTIKNFIKSNEDNIHLSNEDSKLKSKSQYIFKIRQNKKVSGLVIFGLSRKEPLDGKVIKILNPLITILGKHVLYNEKRLKRSIEKAMTQIAHSLTQYINFEGIIFTFLTRAKWNSYSVAEYREFLEKLANYSYGMMLHVGISRVIEFSNVDGEESENIFEALKDENFINKIKSFIRIASDVNEKLCKVCDKDSLKLGNLDGKFTLNFNKRNSARLSQNYMQYIIFELIFNALKAMEHVNNPYIKFYAISGGICIENRVDNKFNENNLVNSKGTGLRNIIKMIEEQGGEFLYDYDKNKNVLKIKFIKRENINGN